MIEKNLRLCFVLSMAFGLTMPMSSVSAAETDDLPKLVLVVSVDQLRRDRVNEHFPGGLGKIVREGRVFTEANLDHALTNTCPGHAVILSGRAPGPAGIPGNTYIDHETMQETYCVQDTNEKYRVIGGQALRSPNAFKVSTFGDWLKSAHPNSKVFAVGGKDRATITMGGHQADGVYWYDSGQGKFTTSGYYAQRLPAYLQTFNGDDVLLDGFLKDLPETWLHDAGSHRVDDYPGEADRFGRTSGHPLGSGQASEIFSQVYRSPVVDSQSIALAKRIVEEEALGMRGSTDLLIIALSATDTVGHLYGPRSAESEDTLKNVDLQLGELIAYLEKKLGKENLLVVLTADHGVAELPEFLAEESRSNCPEQGRISIEPIVASLAWSMYWRFTRPFDKPTDLITFSSNGIVINRKYLADKGLSFSEVEQALDEVVGELDIVEAAWTAEEIKQGKSEVARLLRNSFTEGKSADVQIQLKRDCLLSTYDSGTNHGSVYDYDRDIPVMFYGWGVTPGLIGGEAHSIDIGPTLAKHLGVTMPAQLDGKVLDLRN